MGEMPPAFYNNILDRGNAKEQGARRGNSLIFSFTLPVDVQYVAGQAEGAAIGNRTYLTAVCASKCLPRFLFLLLLQRCEDLMRMPNISQMPAQFTALFC